LYKEQLYNKGESLKFFQIFITDYFPLLFIYLLFVGTIVVIAIRNKRIWGSVVIIGLCGLMVARFGVVPVTPDQQTKPNILIFASDSLRPQNISHNGYHRQTPNIDALFSRGANFLNAKASVARTFSSWTGILTSQFPPQHQIRHMFPADKTVDKDWNSVVKVLNRHGYDTSLISDYAGDFFPRVDFGFQNPKSPHLTFHNLIRQRSLEIHYFLMGFLINPVGRVVFPEMWGAPLFMDPYYVTKETKRAVRRSAMKGKPFFVVAFSSNNHFPYASQYPYYQLYGNENYFRKHKYCKDDVMKVYSGSSIPAEDQQQIRDLYDNATKMFDDNLGEILSFLESSRLDKNTIVIVLSDHGESLYENGYGSGHGDHLRGEYSNNMTFGVFSPFENFNGLKIDNTVRDVDVAPTILDMLGIEKPDSFSGESLLPAMRGRPFAGLPVYMETGLWYSISTPYINDRIRILYPGIKELLYVPRGSGHVILKPQYERTVLKAKYRALQINDYKYIYMPGDHKFREEYYVGEKEVMREDIDDPDFLNFKRKMVEMFDQRFFLDERGFIQERYNGAGDLALPEDGDVLQINDSKADR
jgi:arylsulfatase A-like enzyme